MTPRELIDAFKRHEDEYGEFERITAPLHRRPDLCAFLMLDRLCPTPVGETAHDIVSAAEHDQIWLWTSPDRLAEVVTNEQVRDLVRCGVMLETEGPDDDDDVEALGLFMFA